MSDQSQNNLVHALLEAAGQIGQLTAERDSALAQVAAQAAVIEAVRALHVLHPEETQCVADGRVWRCPTVRLLPPAPVAGTDTEEGHCG